jgi:hypothetical protein
MSGESSLNHNSGRFLRQEEADLLSAMLERHALGPSLLVDIDQRRVRDLRDGDMGSIEFLGEVPDQPRRAECIAEADYMDSDRTPVSIVINVDQRRELFELDIWKVDFNQLRTYPSARTIRNIRHLDV